MVWRPKGTQVKIFEDTEHGNAVIERRIFDLPLSRDGGRLNDLLDGLALYRLTFGQPNLEDLLNYLKEKKNSGEIDKEELKKWFISLEPPKV